MKAIRVAKKYPEKLIGTSIIILKKYDTNKNKKNIIKRKIIKTLSVWFNLTSKEEKKKF